MRVCRTRAIFPNRARECTGESFSPSWEAFLPQLPPAAIAAYGQLLQASSHFACGKRTNWDIYPRAADSLKSWASSISKNSSKTRRIRLYKRANLYLLLICFSGVAAIAFKSFIIINAGMTWLFMYCILLFSICFQLASYMLSIHDGSTKGDQLYEVKG